MGKNRPSKKDRDAKKANALTEEKGSAQNAAAAAPRRPAPLTVPIFSAHGARSVLRPLGRKRGHHGQRHKRGQGFLAAFLKDAQAERRRKRAGLEAYKGEKEIKKANREAQLAWLQHTGEVNSDEEVGSGDESESVASTIHYLNGDEMSEDEMSGEGMDLGGEEEEEEEVQDDWDEKEEDEMEDEEMEDEELYWPWGSWGGSGDKKPEGGNSGGFGGGFGGGGGALGGAQAVVV